MAIVAVAQSSEVAVRISADGQECVYSARMQTTIVACTLTIEHYVDEVNAYGEDVWQHESCGERCADTLCLACGSDLCSCKFSCSGIVRPQRILSAPLRKARNLGMKFLLFDGFVFPLLHHIVRDVVVSAELLYTIVGLILSIVNYVKADCHQTFNVVNLTIGIAAALLGIASSAQALYRRNIFRKRSQGANADTRTYDNSGIAQVIDLLRTVLAELLIYPLLICSIFSLVTSQPSETRTADDIVGLIRFAISGLSFVLFVYVLRIVILAGALFHIQELRKQGSGSYYILLYFLVHVVLQMIVQVFMIVATGREIFEENLHFYNASNLNYTNFEYAESNTDFCLPVIISGKLWYMIIGTYLFPIAGIIMFFVVGYYWVQVFFVGVFIDVKNFLKTPGVESLLSVKKICAEMGHIMAKKLDELENECEDLDDIGCCTKFSYPFRSPAMIISCIAFLVLNYIFIAFGSGISTIGPITLFFALFEFTGWNIVYLFGAIFGVFANLYAFFVGIIWLILLEIIIFIIMVTFPCCVLLLCLGGGGKSEN